MSLPRVVSTGVGLLALWCIAGCGGGYTPVRTHFNKGVYQDSQNNPDAAILEYRLEIEENPLDYRAHFNLACALDRIGKKDEARAEYEVVLVQKPNELRSLCNLAALDYEAGNAAAGEKRLRDAVAAWPDVPLPRIALAWHLVDAGDDAGADALAAQALAVQRGHVEANYLRGVIAARAGQPDDARRFLAAALKTDPDDVASLLALGRVEAGSGNVGAARNAFGRVLNLQRHSFAAHSELASLYEKNGDLEGAVRHLWEARDSDPREDSVKQPIYAARLKALYAALGRE